MLQKLKNYKVMIFLLKSLLNLSLKCLIKNDQIRHKISCDAELPLNCHVGFTYKMPELFKTLSQDEFI